MAHGPGEPPEFLDVDPMMLNDRELGEMHEALGDWVGAAEEAPASVRPPQDLIDQVHDTLRAVAEERAHRRTL